jgi:16S rRNA (cytidine1402-2'-O)-methyltransferase
MGTLYVVATPLGNLEDISLRAIRTLLGSTVIACEDTRRTGNLVKLLTDRFAGISNFQFQISNHKYISVRDWNEAKMVETILLELSNGDVALVSDAGTPLISDPGYKIVRAAREAGYKIVPIPGPSAVTAALSAAGLPTNKFMFWGFLPKKWELLPEMTHVIYESPVRLEKTIQTIKDKYPQAEIVVASELTKIHESIVNVVGMTRVTKGEATILVYIPGEKIAAGHRQGDRNIEDGE